MKKTVDKTLSRKIKMIRTCDYRGIVEETTQTAGVNHCGNEGCGGCNSFVQSMSDAIQSWLDENYTPLTVEEEAELFILGGTKIENE